MRRHGCAATSAVTCAECCRATSTMTATQELDDRICSAIPVVALWRARRCGYLWLGILPGWSAYRLPRIWLPSSPDTLRLYAASRDLVITREAAQPSYGCTAITSIRAIDDGGVTCWASRVVVASPLVKSVRNHALANSEA